MGILYDIITEKETTMESLGLKAIQEQSIEDPRYQEEGETCVEQNIDSKERRDVRARV